MIKIHYSNLIGNYLIKSKNMITIIFHHYRFQTIELNVILKIGLTFDDNVSTSNRVTGMVNNKVLTDNKL